MRALSVAAALLLVLAPAAPAFARAGGGQSYKSSSSSSRSSSSSSRSSSSSSRSSSSSSRSSYSGSRSSSSSSRSSYSSSGGSYSSSSSSDIGDMVGTVLLVLFLVVFVGGAGLVMVVVRSGKDDEATLNTHDAFRNRAQRSIDEAKSRVPEGLRRIKERDPSFDAVEFDRLARRMFVEIQQAWSDGDLSKARRFMSDGVLRRFTAQLALNAFQGRRNVVDQVAIHDTELLCVETDAAFDTLHLSVSASLRDADVAPDDSKGNVQAALNRKEKTHFTELWSFVRRPNPQGGKGHLAEGKCPNCGAPVEQTATATCEYCKVVLNSGTYDWVLSEITQESEIEFRRLQAVDGFDELVARDPALNRQILEDRGSLVFWKYVEAKAMGKPERFRRLCTPTAFGAIEANSSYPATAFEQTAVGTVELLAVEAKEDVDRAFLRVRWSTGGAESGVAHTNVLSLVRKAGLKTNDKLGMSTDRCHSCLAPQTALENATCEYCGAALTEDWSFEQLESPEKFEARLTSEKKQLDALFSRMQMLSTPLDRRRALTAMVAMARADGVVTPKEKKLLVTCAMRWQIAQRTLEALLAAPQASVDSEKPQTDFEKLALYRALLAAALIDGSIDKAEQQLLDSMAAHMGLSAESVTQVHRMMERARPSA